MKTCPTCRDSTKSGIMFREGASECMFCEDLRSELTTMMEANFRKRLKATVDFTVERLARLHHSETKAERQIRGAQTRPPMPKAKPVVALASVMDVVAKTYDVTQPELMGTRRCRRFTEPRHVVSWVMCNLGYGIQDAGRAMRRNHSTVNYSRNTVDAERSAHKDIEQRTDLVLDLVKSELAAKEQK